MSPHRSAFPLGAAIDSAALERNPYPIYAQLQLRGPIMWVRALGMWYVTRYEDVRTILVDTTHFTTASEHSLIFDTFGANMLTTEGVCHERYRRAEHAFLPSYIHRNLDGAILEAARRLVASFRSLGQAELRSAFASRLPIQTVLTLFGMPPEGEMSMRRWYDSFERALSNFQRDEAVRCAAARNVSEFRQYVLEAIDHTRNRHGGSLLNAIVNAPRETRLSDEEIGRNLSIIFFGGISTVEALILNTLWALFTHPHALERVCDDVALVPRVLDETMRWLSPVQSATRHVVCDITYKGVRFRKGDIVNCMLAAANRDPAVFPDPERFDIDRSNAQRHLGFATGPHACLGFNLARTEARIGLQQLLNELAGLRLVDERSAAPEGYEFRQPRRLHTAWNTSPRRLP